VSWYPYSTYRVILHFRQLTEEKIKGEEITDKVDPRNLLAYLLVVAAFWIIKEVEEGHGQAIVMEGVVVRIILLAVVAVADSHEESSLPPATVPHEQVVVDRFTIAFAIPPCVVPDPRIFQAIMSQGVLEVGKLWDFMNLIIILVVRDRDFLPIISHFIALKVSIKPTIKAGLDFI